jgi:AcrR family transcriptional regulator
MILNAYLISLGKMKKKRDLHEIRASKGRQSPKRRQTLRRKANPVGRPGRHREHVAAETAILEAGLELFAQRGLEGVTTGDIARATGFNPALIYYYFKNKNELFRRAVLLAITRAFTRFEEQRRDDDDPLARILTWIDTHSREFETIAKLMNLSLAHAKEGRPSAGIDKAIRKFYDDERDVLRQAIDQGVASGAFRSVDAANVAAFISTYLDGVFMRAVILKSFRPPIAIEMLKDVITDYLTRGSRRPWREP